MYFSKLMNIFVHQPDWSCMEGSYQKAHQQLHRLPSASITGTLLSFNTLLQLPGVERHGCLLCVNSNLLWSTVTVKSSTFGDIHITAYHWAVDKTQVCCAKSSNRRSANLHPPWRIVSSTKDFTNTHCMRKRPSICGSLYGSLPACDWL